MHSDGSTFSHAEQRPRNLVVIRRRSNKLSRSNFQRTGANRERIICSFRDCGQSTPEQGNCCHSSRFKQLTPCSHLLIVCKKCAGRYNHTSTCRNLSSASRTQLSPLQPSNSDENKGDLNKGDLV